MTFDQLVQLAEAKDTRPGKLYHNTRTSNGPADMVASPIGKSDNFEIPISQKKLPTDKGHTDVASVIDLLSKGLSLLKNDDVFADQMKGIMNGFKKNRHQISAYQESVLKSKPKTIDNLWGTINRLTKIANDPKKQQDADHQKWVDELNDAIKTKDEHQAELDAVYDQIDGVTEKNEELNNEYLEQLMTAVKHTTNRLYKKLVAELESDPNNEKLVKSEFMHDEDWENLKKNIEKSSEAQLQLLEMMMSPESSKNPLVSFLDLQENKYNESRDRYYQLRRGDNYSITTDQLYRNLPLFAFAQTFANAILKGHAIKLTTKQKEIAKPKKTDDLLDRLAHIKNEREYEEIKPELIEYIDHADISKDLKKSLTAVANGPFLPRKGRSNAAVKIRSSLNSARLSESFDSYAGRILKESIIDTTDYELDLLELFNK